MKRLTARLVGNFLFSFATTYSGVSIITGGKLDGIALAAGLFSATMSGLISLATELKEYAGNGAAGTKKSRITTALQSVLIF